MSVFLTTNTNPGSRIRKGILMAKTQAERAKEYRQRKRDAEDLTLPENVTHRHEAQECDAPVCGTCGGPVQHPLVVKCLRCCTSVVKDAKVNLGKG